MQESAEVRLTTDYLKSKLENRIIVDWSFLRDRYEKKNPIGFDEFTDNLPLIVENVQCKGKFIYFTLFNERGYFYILHSIQTNGRWQEYKDIHCIWNIELHNGESLWFRNTRCFDTLEFTSTLSVLQKAIEKLGPDILTDKFTRSIWLDILEKHKNKNITSFLMDQNIISGIGNYIKAEALYYAKISPLRKTGSLSESEADLLFEGIRIIPRISYNKNGLCVRDHVNNRVRGTYDEDLKIYGKSHARRQKTSDGQITFWDPKVQI